MNWQTERARVGTARPIAARDARVQHRVRARAPAWTEAVGEYVLRGCANNVGGRTDQRLEPTAELPEALPIAGPAQACADIEGFCEL